MAKPEKKSARDRGTDSINVFFEQNQLLPSLYGEGDEHLARVEQMLNVTLVSRGNMISITGHKRDMEATEKVLQSLYQDLEAGKEVTMAEVDAAIRMMPPVVEGKRTKHADKGIETESDIYIRTMKKTIAPYTHVQANYMRALYDSDMAFALGPAGTGKTYIAVAMAVYQLINKRVERIVLSRPAVEAGEKIGFLPGDIKDKVDPYMRPLYDALFDMMPADRVHAAIESGEIELAPLAFMRGRTFSNAFVILDEAQNTTRTQMKMFLTRMGERSRMVITGDHTQVDLPKDIKSGLTDCIPKIEHIDGIDVVRFSEVDVVRHPLAGRIIAAYDDWESKKRQFAESERDGN